MGKLANRLQCCGICCGLFSILGIGFLLIVGEVMASNTRVVRMDPEERADAARDARLGAAIYAGTLVLSVLCLLGAMRARRSHNAASDLALAGHRQGGAAAPGNGTSPKLRDVELGVRG